MVKKNKRLPLPPSRNTLFSEVNEYKINNINSCFENMSVWYWCASPSIYNGQIHNCFESADKNSQTGFTIVKNNTIIIKVKKPGAYMLKDKIIPSTIFYKIYNINYGYGPLQQIEI